MRLGRGLFTTGIIAHALAVAASQVPQESALGAAVRGFVSPYLAVTGTWQSWDMFDAAPRYHGYSVELIALMPDGTTRAFPPLLPNLAAETTQVRDRTFFIRTVGGSFQQYFAGYAHGACDAVHRLKGVRPDSVRVRQYIEVLRSLEQVRATGVIADERTTDSSAATCLKAEP